MWRTMIWCYYTFSKTSEVTDASIVEQSGTFLIKLKNSNEIQSLLLKSSKDAIIDRTKKKQINETNEAISVYARKRHSSELLEALTPDIFPSSTYLSWLYKCFCQHPKALHTYIEIKEYVICTLIMSLYLLQVWVRRALWQG